MSNCSYVGLSHYTYDQLSSYTYDNLTICQKQKSLSCSTNTGVITLKLIDSNKRSYITASANIIKDVLKQLVGYITTTSTWEYRRFKVNYLNFMVSITTSSNKRKTDIAKYTSSQTVSNPITKKLTSKTLSSTFATIYSRSTRMTQVVFNTFANITNQTNKNIAKVVNLVTQPTTIYNKFTSKILNTLTTSISKLNKFTIRSYATTVDVTSKMNKMASKVFEVISSLTSTAIEILKDIKFLYFAKIDGAWKRADILVKISGQWKEVKSIWRKDNGNWHDRS